MQATRGTSLSDDTTRTGGRRRVGVVLAVAGTILVLDQVTKWLAVRALSDGRVVDVVDGVLSLRLVRNPGAAFSLAEGYPVLLSAVAVGVVVVILRLSRRLVSLPWAVALGGLLGGALGNLIDRLVRAPGPLHGHVVDFLELPRWPVFNVADSAIVGSAALMVALALLGIDYDRTGRADHPDRSHPAVDAAASDHSGSDRASPA